MRPIVFVSDPVPEQALALLRQQAEVLVETGLETRDLAARLAKTRARALLVRSQSRVTAELLEGAPELRIIGRAGVGVDNIEVEAATRQGIVVVNSPEGNTISAAEHTMSLLLAAARRVPQAHASMLRGEWKRQQFTGVELYNKTLGIVGLGRIGREVAARAAAFQMRILAHDPQAPERYARERGVELCALDELLASSDFVTLHVPLTPETENLLDARRLGLMKPGAVLVNCARGGLVDEAALVRALQQGSLGCAALDVYRQEPPTGSALLSLPEVVLTPHLAASTHEAQIRVAVDVAEQILQVLAGGPPRSAVNLAYLPPHVLEALRPYLGLAERLGRLLGALAPRPLRQVRLSVRGEVARHEGSYLTRAALVGLLHGDLDQLNLVNADYLARRRGIQVAETRSAEKAPYGSLLELRVEAGDREMCAAGAVIGDDLPRLVDLDGFRISTVLQGVKLLTRQQDRPGLVGGVGSVLGEHRINIADMQVGRQDAGTRAVMIMSLDDQPPADVLARIAELPGIQEARLVSL